MPSKNSRGECSAFAPGVAMIRGFRNVEIKNTGHDRRTADRRRLIAVAYLDMVAYSRLISLDDVGTLERLRGLRRDLMDPSIKSHGGKIVQTGGDSLLIVFDSIDGAVRCAIWIQQQVPIRDGDQPLNRAIRFRIGISVGDAIADGTDLHGDVVNVAVAFKPNARPAASASRVRFGIICDIELS